MAGQLKIEINDFVKNFKAKNPPGKLRIRLDPMMKQFKVKQLQVALTRKCNYRCEHCMHGDPKNETITPQIIDRILDQFSEIEDLFLTGGETLLELDALEYLVDSLIDHDLWNMRLAFVTNGSILDKRVMDILCKFVREQSSEKARIVKICISDDPYHDRAQSAKALQFYQECIDQLYKEKKIKQRDLRKMYFEKGISPIKVELFHTYDSYDNLIYSGNAKNYIEKKQLTEEPTFHIYHPKKYTGNHQLCVDGDVIKCPLEFYPNGSVGLAKGVTYDIEDKLALGNIMEHSLETIITNHNRSCLYLCDEIYNEIEINNRTDFASAKKRQEEFHGWSYLKLQKEMYYSIWRLREIAHKHFPKLPVQEIIKKIPIFSNAETNELLVESFENYKDKIKMEMVNIYNDLEIPLDKLWVPAMLNLIKDDVIQKPIIPFGSEEEILQSDLFKKLSALEQEYISGKRSEPLDFNACEWIADSYAADK